MSNIGPTFPPQFGTASTKRRAPQFGSFGQESQGYNPYLDPNPIGTQGSKKPEKSGGIFKKAVALVLAGGGAILGFRYLKNQTWAKEFFTKIPGHETIANGITGLFKEGGKLNKLRDALPSWTDIKTSLEGVINPIRKLIERFLPNSH